MNRILFTNNYTVAPLKIVNEELPSSFEAVFLSDQTENELIEKSKSIDYIIAGGRIKISKKVLRNADNLKMIQRSGVGLDSLDLDAIKEKGIPLYVNKGINADSVAEHALMLMLACLRRLPQADGNTKSGIWNKQGLGIQTAELRGKTVGIVGMGSIAKRLVSLLKPFQVHVLYNDLYRAPLEFETENQSHYVSIEKLLSESDIVSINCALTPDTKHLIDSKTISQMKDGAILVNTARGSIIDAEALAQALRTGKLSFAGLDVHEEEPISADYPLLGIENVILTPHIGGVTADSFRSMMRAAFRNISLFDQGRLEEIESNRVL